MFEARFSSASHIQKFIPLTSSIPGFKTRGVATRNSIGDDGRAPLRSPRTLSHADDGGPMSSGDRSFITENSDDDDENAVSAGSYRATRRLVLAAVAGRCSESSFRRRE